MPQITGFMHQFTCNFELSLFYLPWLVIYYRYRFNSFNSTIILQAQLYQAKKLNSEILNSSFNASLTVQKI